MRRRDQAEAKRLGQRTWEGRTGCNATAGRHRKAGKPTCARAPRARAFGRDPSSRKALWPAVMRTAPTGRTHGRTDQAQQNIKITLAKGEPSTHGAFRRASDKPGGAGAPPKQHLDSARASAVRPPNPAGSRSSCLTAGAPASRSRPTSRIIASWTTRTSNPARVTAQIFRCASASRTRCPRRIRQPAGRPRLRQLRHT